MKSGTKSFLWYFIPAAAVLLSAGIFSLMGIDMHHDGVMFQAAAEAARGKLVFRDIFCQYGILPPLFQGALLKIFGMELLVLKLATVLFYGGIILLCDQIWKRFLTPGSRAVNLLLVLLLAPYSMVTFHIWSSVYALFFMLLATELLIQFLEKNKVGFLFFTGVCAMIILGFRWTCGTVMFPAVFAVLLITRAARGETFRFWKSLLVFLAGAAVVGGIYAAYISFAGAWEDCFRQCFGFATGFAERRGGYSWSKIMQSLYPIYSSNQFFDCVFALFPLSCILLGAVSCFKLLSSPREVVPALPLIAAVVIALAAWHQYHPVPCVRHLYWGAVPMMGGFVLVLQKIRQKEDYSRKKKIILLTLLGIFCLMAASLRLYAGTMRIITFPRRHKTDLPGLRGMRLTVSEKRMVLGAQELCRMIPENIRKRGIFNYTKDGLVPLLFPGETGFDHPMFVNWGRDVYRDYPEKAMEFIQKIRPAVAADKVIFISGYRLAGSVSHHGTEYLIYLPEY